MTLPTDPSWLWRLWTETQETRPEWAEQTLVFWEYPQLTLHWLVRLVFVAFQSNKNDKSGQHKNVNYSDFLLSRRIGLTFSSHLTNVSLVPDTSQRQPPWLWEHYIPTSEISPGYLVSDAVPWHGLTQCMLMLAQCNDQSRVAGLCLCLGREWCWR